MRWFDKTVLKRMPIMNKPLNPLPFGGTRRIFVAGHRGMVGAALVRALSAQSGIELVLRSHDELDLCDAQAVADFFSSTSSILPPRGLVASMPIPVIRLSSLPKICRSKRM